MTRQIVQTIIDIRVHDQVGLLYTISDAFYRLGLNIHLAKITTEAFIAEDSFYVTDTNGGKDYRFDPTEKDSGSIGTIGNF